MRLVSTNATSLRSGINSTKVSYVVFSKYYKHSYHNIDCFADETFLRSYLRSYYNHNVDRNRRKQDESELIDFGEMGVEQLCNFFVEFGSWILDEELGYGIVAIVEGSVVAAA